jgi:hypothetical protein
VDDRSSAPLWPLFAICSIFLAFGVATLGDVGLTLDEAESTEASREAWAVLSGSQSQFSEHHAIPGYYLALDLSREVFARAAALLRPGVDRVLAEHLFNLLMATASLAFVYLLAFEIGRSSRAAALAAAALAAMPAFVAQSQNNPKDLPALLVFVLTFWFLVRATREPSALRTALATVALGISLNTRTFSVYLLPLFGLWLAVCRPNLARQRIGQLAVIGSVAALIGIALWPWLWLDDPFDQIQRVREIIANKLQVSFPVLYLGKTQLWTEVPWHYSVFHILATLPLSLLLLAAASPIAAALRGERRPAIRDLVWTGALWVGALVGTDLLAPARYDGMRHYLMILPGLSLLIGAGAEWLIDWLETRRSFGAGALTAKLAGWTIVMVAIGVAGWETARTHPYQSAYLNPIASALGGDRTEEWVEVEYWGRAFKEGAEWLNEHAEPDAVVYVPFGDHVAAHYLKRETESQITAAQFADPARPRYLMFITRRALYKRIMHHAETRWEPVFEIQRQRATLLRIYRNRAPAATG